MAATTRSCASIYDVFLSFKGEDTRQDFTGYVYKALDDRGIYTFIDDEELPRGDKITPALFSFLNPQLVFVISVSFCF
ncbi:hypothetical protein AAZX31_16G191200 [Glycine max]|nr:hypothetical protein JHK86_045996 [Glycine max]